MAFARFFGFMRRLLLGEDIVLVRQTNEQWEQQFAGGTWDRLQGGQLNTAEIARLILEYAHMSGRPIRVLDVGCGNGGLARLLATEPGITYTGIDISASALQAARLAAPDACFIVADAEEPPTDLGIFDILVFNEVLYYVNPDRVLPRYRIHATAGATILISMARSWRSPFVFHRIRRHLSVEKRMRITSSASQWDLTVNHFV